MDQDFIINITANSMMHVLILSIPQILIATWIDEKFTAGTKTDSRADAEFCYQVVF